MSGFVLALLPLLGAALAYALPLNRLRPLVLPAVATAHLLLTLYAVQGRPVLPGDQWFMLDPAGKIVLLTISILFFCCALYAPGYLRHHATRSNRMLCTCLLWMLSMMTVVTHAQHLGLMWVAMEATALSSAPLIYFRHTPEAIEATWKYLLLSSIGVALALLGSFFLAYAAMVGGGMTSLLFSDLVQGAPDLSKPWLHAAFVTLLVGYGTKMGLAPMHTWKPDAYGEAPGVIGALLAGGLTSCAFLAIARFTMVLSAAGDAALAHRLLIGLGLLSMGTAAAFLARQRDFKRMLAYSSVEHMGILAIGMGIGGLGVFGALLHLINNALTKGVLFLAAANIHRTYGSKSVDEVRGAFQRAPLSAAFFLMGFIAIAGSPPFGPFVSLFSILQAAFERHYFLTGAALLIMLWAIFIGMGWTVLRVVQGAPVARPPQTGDLPQSSTRERKSLVVPVAVLACLVLLMGIWIPAPLGNLLREAAAYLEVQP
ncbi:MAG: hydrogenase [Candidatus Hydrogenedentes bacterium]|nr:hydrogenase [Candidatus Hydrogenedentota bacterium]